VDQLNRRSGTRITITVPASVVETLSRRALAEGRSLSNLAAFLLEQHLQDNQGQR
jgi:hypothetical protein